ncbi:MAG: aminoglycoside phosphotransferase family protein [Firmicutes bacterium]|nr:aminoglycoside phosphotransferase family protein [Bacillota bacterium]
MKNIETILFYNFLKQNPKIASNLINKRLKYNKKRMFIENEIMPIANENGFTVFWQDFIENESPQSFQKVEENELENVVGGIMNRKFIAKSLLGVTLFSGLLGSYKNTSAGNNMENFNKTSITNSQKIAKQTFKRSCQFNELSNDEKVYFENFLENKYKIIKQAGMSGNKTSAYLMEDTIGNQFILKMPNNPEEETWIQNQKESFDRVKELTKNWRGDIQLPECVFWGETFIVEKYLGEDFSSDAYDKLSDNEKQKVAKDLAEILAFIHNQGATEEVAPRFQIFNNPSFTIKDCFDYLKPSLTNEEMSKFLAMVEQLEKMDTSDEYVTNCHRDIRRQNILYNHKTKKLAVIDFELSGKANRYVDFGGASGGSYGLNYKMLSNVIDEYNRIFDKKINKEKAKLIHKLLVIYEAGSVAKFLDNITDVEEIKDGMSQFVLPKLEKIDKEFS